MNLSFLQPAEDTSADASSARFAGVSMIELLVAISVITLVTGFVLVQRSSFSRSVNLQNVAQETALAIRQAQIYGTSNRGSSIGSDIDAYSHGVHFNSSNPKEFRLSRYTVSSGASENQEIERYQLPDPMEIVELCLVNDDNAVGDYSCADNSGASQPSELTIMFTRPNPDADFYNASGSEITGYSHAAVILEHTSGRKRAIIVGATGFITVD